MGLVDVAAHLEASAALLARMRADAPLADAVAAAAAACTQAIRAGGRVLFCGNGGSAADAQHWAAELVGRFRQERAPIAAIALTTDGAALTAIGNDYAFEEIFARQVRALGRAGDVLVAISTSGRSGNVLAALRAARAAGITTIGFTAEDPREMAGLCDITLRIPASDTALVQQGHGVLGHALCGLIEDALSQ